MFTDEEINQLKYLDIGMRMAGFLPTKEQVEFVFIFCRVMKGEDGKLDLKELPWKSELKVAEEILKQKI